MQAEDHEYYKIGRAVADRAYAIFCLCKREKDFCVQNASSLVFGSTNRIYWTTFGFKADTSYCTKGFLVEFNKLMKGV